MKINLKKFILWILVVITLVIGGIMALAYPTFGTIPEGDDLSRIEKSPNYDKLKKKFVNRIPDLVEKNMKENMTFEAVQEWFAKRESSVPEMKLPEVKPDINKFIKKSEHVKVIWFGHSSLLLNISGKIILIDPIFSRAASPIKLFVKRFQKPVLSLEELPEIDLVVISHDHYDHLDMKTMKYFKNKKVNFILPLGVGSHLKGWGIESSRIAELDWWGKIKKHGIEFIAAPAQHFSGRGLNKRDRTLWVSWIIRNGKQNIYYSGDSGYDTHFKKIGDKYGPFDLAFLETGQYNKRWREVHMFPEDGAQAYFDLRAKRYFPIHWGMFELALHSWFHPALEINKEAEKKGINLITPRIGEVINVNGNLKTSRWWEKMIVQSEENKDVDIKL